MINDLLEHFNDFYYNITKNNDSYKNYICIYNNGNYKIYKYMGDRQISKFVKKSGYVKKDLSLHNKILLPLTNELQFFLEYNMKIKINTSKQQGVLFD